MPETNRLRRALNFAVGRVRDTGARIADRLRRGRAARRAVRGGRRTPGR
jgi:hypothetical protein